MHWYCYQAYIWKWLHLAWYNHSDHFRFSKKKLKRKIEQNKLWYRILYLHFKSCVRLAFQNMFENFVRHLSLTVYSHIWIYRYSRVPLWRVMAIGNYAKRIYKVSNVSIWSMKLKSIKTIADIFSLFFDSQHDIKISCYHGT